MKKYFRIKNWEKFQHRDFIRGDGPMKYIRLNVSSLYDEKLFELTPHEELTWYKLLLKSGQTRNKLPYNPLLLKHELRLSRKPNLALFEELGLIEVLDARKLPENCVEKTPIREEMNRKASGPPTRTSADFI